MRLINGHYEIDFDELEGKFNPEAGMMPLPSRARMMILSSPHNPVGRVWTREELIRMGEIVLKNNAVTVSDEIHCELLVKGSTHIPFDSISREFEQCSVICMAPSKAFNLAGLHASSIIIPNDELRSKFVETGDGIVPSVNILGLTAMEASYRNGDEWLEQFLSYMQGNLEFPMQYLREEIPKIKAIKSEGTYLVWLDCRGLGLNPMILRAFMREKARVGFDDGFLFGSSGGGFQRINIALPTFYFGRSTEEDREGCQ
ncbi:MAG: aminotransferase class I/II-fold pyridoxal phosphate-dependent enzyme [Dehalococcoidia bacterium]|nr:aminotransferase class I/II-fold pyridoxal phosphate-dependent enzyme [Dehalococcoidia bacterium]